MPETLENIDGRTLLGVLLDLTGIGAVYTWMKSIEATREYAGLVAGLLLVGSGIILIILRERE